MKTGVRDFCKAVLKKVKNDKDIEENPVEILWADCRDRISFGVCIIKSAPGIQILGFRKHFPDLILDQEDIDYLYNKYSKKLTEEMEDNIKDLKKGYNENSNNQ